MTPNISILSLGGTIAMTREADTKGVVPTLTAAELVAVVPELEEIATITAQTFRSIPSSHLTFDDLEALAIEIENHIKRGAQGIVITQGTDTIEETAFVLDLLLDIKAPVIVTGAMRNPTRAGSDGAANLLAAVEVASSPKAHNLGVLVVFNDEIHAARFVTKTHTSNVATFSSAPLGPIGYLAEDQVRILLRLHRAPPLPRAIKPRNICVPIIRLSLGDDAKLIEAAAQAGVDGLVIEALGGGHVLPVIADALEVIIKSVKKIPVILTARAGQGESLTRTYGFVGSEIDLISRGLISGGRLNGTQARVILTLLLRHSNTFDIGIISSIEQYLGTTD